MIVVRVFILVLFAAHTLNPCVTRSPAAEVIDQRKFEPLYRAGKSIEGATAVAAPYLKFGQLLQSLATEVLAAKERAQSAEERVLVAMYAATLLIYNESHDLWKAKIANASNPSLVSVPAQVAARYGIAAAKNSEPGGAVVYVADADVALKQIWAAGSQELAKAELAYAGRFEELRSQIHADKMRATEAEQRRIADEQSRAAAKAKQEEQRAKVERAKKLDADRRAEKDLEARRKGYASFSAMKEAEAKVEADARKLRDERAAARRKELIEQVYREFNEAERDAKRPKPIEYSTGSWGCPRGWFMGRGKCLSEAEIKTDIPSEGEKPHP